MKFKNDLQFLSLYWEEAKKLGEKIKEELPNYTGKKPHKKNVLQFIKYKDLENWKVEDNLRKQGGFNKNLVALSTKIDDMINRYRSKDIEPMLKSILSERIKVWRTGYDNKGSRNKRREKKFNYEIMQFFESNEEKFYNGNEQEFCYGHFRYESKGYILTKKELERIKEYLDKNRELVEDIDFGDFCFEEEERYI